MIAELVEPVGALLGEGPQLFPDGTVRWVDLLAGKVFIRKDGRSTVAAAYPHEVSKVLPWTHGHLTLTRASIDLVAISGQTVASIDLTAGDDTLRCSDATVLPHGGVAVGIVDRDLAPGRGRLVVVHPDGTIAHVVGHATIPNGIDVMPNGDEVVWVDSPTHTLTRFNIDPDTGNLVNAREWVTLPSGLGVPDGLCADADGGVWVAMWGGGKVIHVDNTGAVDATISLPVDHVTSVAFDVDDTLIITTGSVVLSEEDRVNILGAGGLWGVSASAHGTRGMRPRIATFSPHNSLPSHCARRQPDSALRTLDRESPPQHNRSRRDDDSNKKGFCP